MVWKNVFTDLRKEKKTKNAAVILRCSEARIKPDTVWIAKK